MEQSRFFRWVWQVNGLLIMAVSVLAIGFLSYKAFNAAKRWFGVRSLQSIVNIDKSDEVKETLGFGYMVRVGGSRFVMISQESDQEYSQNHFTKSTTSIRNWLFVDTKGSDRHWLLEGHKNLISDTEHLSIKNSNAAEGQSVKALMYTVISKDTNNDGRLTEKDANNIAFSRPNGKDYRIIVEGADNLLGHQMVDEKTVFILYKKSGHTYSRTINLDDFSSTAETQLPEAAAAKVSE